MSADLLRTHPLLEEIFATHREHARGDDVGYEGYRGHAYRVLNLARAIVPDDGDRDDKLAVAAAFHDLDAFSALDYLASSIRAQDVWLQRTGRSAWAPELAVVVAQHHRFRAPVGRWRKPATDPRARRRSSTGRGPRRGAARRRC